MLCIDEEHTVPSAQTAVTTCLFKETCSRYWRISIQEIPFSSFHLKDFMELTPDYTCGSPEYDPPTIPVSNHISIDGPVIQFIDVYGCCYYPSLPPLPMEVWECSLPIHHLRLWSVFVFCFIIRDNTLALFSAEQRVLLIHQNNNSLYRIDQLPSSSSVLFIHQTV